MGPPAIGSPGCPAEIGLYWTDEEVVLFLDKCTLGLPLPTNVIDYINPFQYKPSVLPDEIWFLVPSSETKETDCGFWKSIGDDCEIYSNSSISGWRTTLEFFEGQAPHGQRTDWLMQEYRVTQKALCNKSKTKESKSLCRVFFCSERSPRNEMHPKDCKTAVDVKHNESVASIIQTTNSTSRQDSTSEPEAKRVCEVELFPVADRLPNYSPEEFPKLEYILGDSLLELDDLKDTKSHNSSSANSTCPTIASDDYHDAMALLWDLDDEYGKDMQEKGSSFRNTFIASVRNTEVVLRSAPSDSLLGVVGTVTRSTSERSLTSSTVKTSLTGERVLEHTTKQKKPDDVAAPSTSHKNEKERASADRMEKIWKYFCFAPF
ncbi:NAC transcription factor 29-like [Abeliophyllum distichum]|uniref:NAC transcription factor 29-like n=1 Tax=Abeliophyllum distichum TaxID=126358 RepID=A0ABD1Q6G1_9LAMI